MEEMTLTAEKEAVAERIFWRRHGNEPMTHCRVVILCAMLLTPLAALADEGTLIVHGGGVVSAEVRTRFWELAGGRRAKLLVISTADADTPEDDGRLQTWRDREPASVALLHAASREQAEQIGFSEPLQQSTGVWISGGKQSLLAATYLRTPVERELSRCSNGAA